MLYEKNDAGREVDMAKFKCKLSSNIRQDFPNHFLSLGSEARKRRQSKFSSLMCLAETTKQADQSLYNAAYHKFVYSIENKYLYLLTLT